MTRQQAEQNKAWEDLMKSMPKQTMVPFDSQGIQRYLAQFQGQMDNIMRTDPTDFSPKGMSQWLGVNYGNVDATREAGKALQYNQANMPTFTRMAGQLTQADTAARMSQLDTINPQWRAERDQANAVNQSWMRGEVSKDVQDMLQRNRAFQGLMGGGGSGANVRAATARDLGITSTDLQSRGQEGALKWQSMLGQLLPQVTSAAGVMESQGLSAKDTISTALTNAAQNLVAQTSNAAGMQQAAEFNINAGQKAAELASRERMGYDQMSMEGAARVAELGTSSILNRYNAELNASNTLFANMWRPFVMSAERLGNVQGQTSSRPYGI